QPAVEVIESLRRGGRTEGAEERPEPAEVLARRLPAQRREQGRFQRGEVQPLLEFVVEPVAAERGEPALPPGRAFRGRQGAVEFAAVVQGAAEPAERVARVEVELGPGRQ